VTAIFAGDETSTGDEGREGEASSAKGEAGANPPCCSLPPVAAKSAAAAKAPGEKAAAENAAATAVKAAAAASPAAERRRLADQQIAKSVAAASSAAASPAAKLRCQAACDLHAAKLTYTPPTSSLAPGPAVARAAAENAAAEKAATAEPPPKAFRRREGEPVGARADWPHLLTFCLHID
jgi:hypothetical protein